MLGRHAYFEAIGKPLTYREPPFFGKLSAAMRQHADDELKCVCLGLIDIATIVYT